MAHPELLLDDLGDSGEGPRLPSEPLGLVPPVAAGPAGGERLAVMKENPTDGGSPRSSEVIPGALSWDGRLLGLEVSLRGREREREDRSRRPRGQPPASRSWTRPHDVQRSTRGPGKRRARRAPGPKRLDLVRVMEGVPSGVDRRARDRGGRGQRGGGEATEPRATLTTRHRAS